MARVLLPPALRAHAGGVAELSAQGATLAEVLADLARRHPRLGEQLLDEQGRLRRYLTVYVGERDSRDQGGLHTAVAEDEEVFIAAVIAGGGGPVVPSALLAEVLAHARAAYPEECCGWLAGPRGEDRLTEVRCCANAQGPAHPLAPGRGRGSAFLLSGADLLALCRALDGDAPPRVLYHSHPDGEARMSPIDRAAALAPDGAPLYPLAHLVVAVAEGGQASARLWLWDGARGDFVDGGDAA